MSVTIGQARAAVRAAAAEGVQTTVTLDDGTQRSGTARWTMPSDRHCRGLMLFGCLTRPAPYSVDDTDPGAFRDADGEWFKVNDPDVTCTIPVGIDQLTAIEITPADSPLLPPGTANIADPRVGKRTNGYGTLTPDLSWSFGTGLE